MWSQRQKRDRALFSAISAWTTAILTGVVLLKVARPETRSRALDVLMRLEAVHIVAHIFLYGTLAVLARAASRRWWPPLVLVGVVGVVQEAAQGALSGRLIGPPEAFDLAVDMAAASVVLLGAWLLGRGSTTRATP